MERYGKSIFIFVIIVTFLFLRFYHLEESLTVGSDQGIHLLEIYKLFKTRKISLLGPVSSFRVHGRNFFFGPATYYLPMPFLVLSGWNPIATSYFMIFLQLTAFLILYKTLCLRFPKSNLAMYYALIFIFSPIMVNYARFFWNPNLMVPTSILLLSVLLVPKKGKSYEIYYSGLIGFLLGLGMQFHYSYFLIIILTLIWLYITHRLSFTSFLFLTGGFIAGFSPIILFELRHNFYNLRTFIEFVLLSLKGDNAGIYTPGYIPEYYSLPLLPFVYLFVSQFLLKLEKISQYLLPLLITGYITFSLVKVLPVPAQGFLSFPGWNYDGLKKAEKIILTENRDKYNLVDLLTGDVRAMYLRALLTLGGKPPVSVDGYPDSQFLFLYSKEPIAKLLEGSLWEMDVIKPLKVSKKWYLQNEIYLYLLERVPKVKKK